MRTPKQLDLRDADPALAVFSRRFFDDDLLDGANSRAFASFDRSRFSDELLDAGRSAWELRALDEYRSQVGFTEFLLELTELGCSFDILATGVRVVRDEARHVELCRRMVVALGGDGVIPGEPPWVRSEVGAPLLTRVLRTVMGSLCVGETLSMALLAATRKLTREPLTRSVLTVLAADESIHSQFGWRLLHQLWPVTPKRLRRQLLHELEEVFRAAHEVVFEGSATEPKRRNPFGDLKADERRAVYRKSLERDVLRRFEALDIAARPLARRAGIL